MRMPTKAGTKKCGTCKFMRLENRSAGYCSKLDVTIVSYEKKPTRTNCSFDAIVKESIHHTYQGVTV